MSMLSRSWMNPDASYDSTRQAPGRPRPVGAIVKTWIDGSTPTDAIISFWSSVSSISTCRAVQEFYSLCSRLDMCAFRGQLTADQV